MDSKTREPAVKTRGLLGYSYRVITGNSSFPLATKQVSGKCLSNEYSNGCFKANYFWKLVFPRAPGFQIWEND